MRNAICHSIMTKENPIRLSIVNVSFLRGKIEYSATINDDAAMAQLREEKFDFAIAHHLEFCPVSVIHALGVSDRSHYLGI